MDQAVLNISLDEKLCPGPIEQRFRMVMAACRLCFHDVVGEIQTCRYDGPEGAVREQCAVVTVGFEVHRFALEDAVKYLASQFGQDCIAVMYVDGTGRCVGHRADRWPFDAKFFNLPAVCQLGAAAA